MLIHWVPRRGKLIEPFPFTIFTKIPPYIDNQHQVSVCKLLHNLLAEMRHNRYMSHVNWCRMLNILSLAWTVCKDGSNLGKIKRPRVQDCFSPNCKQGCMGWCGRARSRTIMSMTALYSQTYPMWISQMKGNIDG